MRILRVGVVAAGTLLLFLYCYPRYGIWSLVILPVGLVLLLLASMKLPASAARRPPVVETKAPPTSEASAGSPATVTEVIAQLTIATKLGGGRAAMAEAGKLSHERIRCGDCGTTFVLSDGTILGHPPAHRVASAADREKLYGYTIECPACHKGGFVGILI
jgi:hypothetical protein